MLTLSMRTFLLFSAVVAGTLPPGQTSSFINAVGAPPPTARAPALADSLSSRGAAGAAQTRTAAVDAARAEINRLIAASGAEVAVIWRPLDVKGGHPAEDIAISPTLRFHAASTMKVPVMIELFR